MSKQHNIRMTEKATTSVVSDKNQAYNELKKENQGLIHISYSELSKYMECGHRHFLDKVLHLEPFETSIHLIFGNAIHSAFEMGVKKGLTKEQRIAHFRYKFTKDMNDEMKEHPDFNKLDEFTLQGENIIKILSIEKMIEKYEVISAEEPLYEKLHAQYRFKGFIDLVLRNKENLRYLIIDYKTSTEPWDVNKKKKDEVFMNQMRLYKYFYARKFSIPMNMIDCKYIVLNRLKSKKLPELGFGSIQPVEIYSNIEDIEKSIMMVGNVMKSIHIDRIFPKVKLTGNSKGCFFCPHKNNPTLCSSDPSQYLTLLKEHKK